MFDAGIHGVHQIDREPDEEAVTADDLLTPPQGPVTLDGVRTNVHTTIRYLAAWLGGNGSVAIRDMVENTGTA